MNRPQPPEGWASPSVPDRPDDFYAFDVALPAVRFLADLHPHERDGRLQFHQDTHTYVLDGVPLPGSVTGLIHEFSQGFDEDDAIRKMKRGAVWPRPGYLALPPDPAVIRALRQRPDTTDLVRLLEQRPVNETSVCEALRRYGATSPDANHLVGLLAMKPAAIKAMWDVNRVVAANKGTWMHFTIEAWLNRVPISDDSVESALFRKFARTLGGLTAYRTEWTIFGEDELLAGSIDFVARDGRGASSCSIGNARRTCRAPVVWRGSSPCRE